MQNDEVVEPVIAAPAEGTIATESATEETAESQAAAAEATRTSGVQKRIDELTRKAKDTERENEALRRLLVSPPKPAEVVKPAVVEAPKEKPKADDFATQEEYVEALTDYKLEQRAKADEVKGREEALRTEQRTAQQQLIQRTNEFKAVATDFDDVMAGAGDIQISPAVTNEILTHEQGPALQYYLAKNPAEADRLNKLNPLALAREVGRLEPRFTIAPVAGDGTQEPVKRAPAPIVPITRTSATSTKDPGDMSPAEYSAWHAKTYPNAR